MSLLQLPYSISDFIIRFVNDLQDDGGSKLEIDCLKGTVVIKLNTPLKGKAEMVKTDVDYKTLHQVVFIYKT